MPFVFSPLLQICSSQPPTLNLAGAQVSLAPVSSVCFVPLQTESFAPTDATARRYSRSQSSGLTRDGKLAQKDALRCVSDSKGAHQRLPYPAQGAPRCGHRRASSKERRGRDSWLPPSLVWRALTARTTRSVCFFIPDRSPSHPPTPQPAKAQAPGALAHSVLAACEKDRAQVRFGLESCALRLSYPARGAPHCGHRRASSEERHGRGAWLPPSFVWHTLTAGAARCVCFFVPLQNLVLRTPRRYSLPKLRTNDRH